MFFDPQSPRYNAPLCPDPNVWKHGRLTWLEDDPWPPLTGHTPNFSRIMDMGGYQLAEAMIEDAIALATLELTAADAILSRPGASTRDEIYEANLRRIKALELALNAVRKEHHRYSPPFEAPRQR